MNAKPQFPPPGGMPGPQQPPAPSPVQPPHGGHSSLPPPPLPPTPSPRPQRGRAGFAAAVLVGALVVGGGAGLGGAAAYDALDDDGTAGSDRAPIASQVVSSSDEAAPEGSVEQVAQTVLPSVVELSVAGPQGTGSGSGIVLDSEGLILTNQHVVAVAGDDGRITVLLHDGSKADAEIVGTDPLTDTALVQAEDVSGLQPATIGRSANLDVGERVVAIGSPYGLDATVTSGIVSALDRPVAVGSDAQGRSTTYPAIQTDAAINPGNSGGPLVDMKGRVVGINSSIRTAAGGDSGSIGLGFAIPIDEVLPIVDQMKAGETPTHARLGITVSDVAGPGGADAPEGALVQEIGDGTAAEEAGLRQGDIITAVDEHQVTGADSLVATVRSYRPGDEVEVTYVRDGESDTTTLTLGSDAEGSDS